MYIQLGEETLQTVHRTFQPDIPVILHLLALADGSLHSKSTSTPTLFVIQEGLNCLETTDYFFTNIEPALIIVKRQAVHQNTTPPQQAASRDTISQQTHPQQPDKTRIYPSMLTNRYQRLKYRVNNYLIVILQMKRQIHDFVHQKRKESMG